jgi:hypothetical protein
VRIVLTVYYCIITRFVVHRFKEELLANPRAVQSYPRFGGYKKYKSMASVALPPPPGETEMEQTGV